MRLFLNGGCDVRNARERAGFRGATRNSPLHTARVSACTCSDTACWCPGAARCPPARPRVPQPCSLSVILRQIKVSVLCDALRCGGSSGGSRVRPRTVGRGSIRPCSATRRCQAARGGVCSFPPWGPPLHGSSKQLGARKPRTGHGKFPSLPLGIYASRLAAAQTVDSRFNAPRVSSHLEKYS